MLKNRVIAVVEDAILNHYCDIRNVPRLQVGSSEVSQGHARRAAEEIVKGPFGDVARERERQDAIWGGERHDNGNSVQDWTSYITVYNGQAAKDWRFVDRRSRLLNFRENMVKVAALAIAAIEWTDRLLSRIDVDERRETANYRSGM